MHRQYLVVWQLVVEEDRVLVLAVHNGEVHSTLALYPTTLSAKISAERDRLPTDEYAVQQVDSITASNWTKHY